MTPAAERKRRSRLKAKGVEPGPIKPAVALTSFEVRLIDEMVLGDEDNEPVSHEKATAIVLGQRPKWTTTPDDIKYAFDTEAIRVGAIRQIGTSGVAPSGKQKPPPRLETFEEVAAKIAQLRPVKKTRNRPLGIGKGVKRPDMIRGDDGRFAVSIGTVMRKKALGGDYDQLFADAQKYADAIPPEAWSLGPVTKAEIKSAYIRGGRAFLAGEPQPDATPARGVAGHNKADYLDAAWRQGWQLARDRAA